MAKGILGNLSRAPVYSVETKALNMEERTLEVVITTTKRDRDGDIIESRGLDFANFLKNPVVLWAHDMSKPPVGKVLSVKARPSQVDAVVQFAETAFGLEVFKLYAGGYLNAWSIGFLPKRWERIEPNDTTPNMPSELLGFHVLEAEVVELSAVPVPANPEALAKALESSETEEMRKALRDGWEKNKPEEEGEEQREVKTAIFKASALTLPEDAFRKTISDRAKGRFPVVFEPVGKNGPEITVEYEAVKQDDGRIVEAKLLSVKLAVLAPAAEAPGQPGRKAQGEDGADDSKKPQVGKPDMHRMEADVEESRASLALLEVEIAQIFNQV
jgi:phage head maturation protease